MTSADVLEIYSGLANIGICIWIDGEWGVDALLGRQTRPHKELEIAIEDHQLLRPSVAAGVFAIRDVSVISGVQGIFSSGLLSKPFRDVVLHEVKDLLNITKCCGGVVVIVHQSMVVLLTIWGNLIDYEACLLHRRTAMLEPLQSLPV